MILNPYKPTHIALNESTTWRRLLYILSQPIPVRTAPGHRMRWVFDAMIAFGLSIAGAVIAGLIRDGLWFLNGMAFPTSFVIASGPVSLWLQYCGVARYSWRSETFLIVALMAFMAFLGFGGLLVLSVALGVLAVLLPLELHIGKLMLALLPGSTHRQKRTEPGDRHGAADNPFSVG